VNSYFLICLLLAADSDSAPQAARIPYCGVAAVYGIAKLNGLETSPGDVESVLRRRYPEANLSSLSLKQLRETLSELGLSAQSFQIAQGAVDHVPTPCIAYFRPERIRQQPNGIGHVVILASIKEDVVRILDLTESRSPIDMPLSEFRESWDGEYLAVSREPQSQSTEYLTASTRRVIWLTVAAVALVVFIVSIRRPA